MAERNFHQFTAAEIAAIQQRNAELLEAAFAFSARIRQQVVINRFLESTAVAVQVPLIYLLGNGVAATYYGNHCGDGVAYMNPKHTFAVFDTEDTDNEEPVFTSSDPEQIIRWIIENRGL